MDFDAPRVAPLQASRSEKTASEVARYLGVKARKVLGLKGEVERKDFVALVNNRWPGANGKRLNARMNKTRLEGVKDK